MPVEKDPGFYSDSSDLPYSSSKLRQQSAVAPGLKSASVSQSDMYRKLSTLRETKKEGDAFDYSNPQEIQAGMIVEHQRFGRGKVLQMEGIMPDLQATVFFQNTGKKQLLLKFAKLRIIS